MENKRSINRTVEFMLTVFGVWPGISVFYRGFWVITLTITVFLQFWYFVTHFHVRYLFNLMDCLSSFLAFLKVFFRVTIFSFKQRKFDEIVTTTVEDWNDCGNNGITLREMKSKAKLSSRISNGLIILHTIGGLAYVISILVTVVDIDVTNRTEELPLVMKMEHPFVIDTQRKYRLVLATQFVLVMVCTWGAGLFNGLFLTLTLHVGSQINILLYWLREIGSKDIDKKDDSFLTVMTKIIRKHKKIISLSEDIEDLYSHIALVQFASNTLLICSLGFLIVTTIGSPDATEQIMRSLIFFTVTNVEAFIFCFAGEYLNNKSKEIGNAAYNSSWYDMKAKHSRVLLFIILRSQRQLQLTAGKMVLLSLECFANIMKASGSYLSILLAMK